MKSKYLELLNDVTHCSFSDESNHNTGRFRSISLVSLPKDRVADLDTGIETILNNSSISELKWTKLKTARMRFGIKKLIDLVMDFIDNGNLRVDTLIWDTEDSRHSFMGRNDVKNLQIMYYQLFKNVACQRWDGPCFWKMFPDQNNLVEWAKMKDFIERQFYNLSNGYSLEPETFLSMHTLEKIHEVESHLVNPVQVADIFAGLGTFSHMHYETYQKCVLQHSGQRLLFGDEINQSNGINEKSRVLTYFIDQCKSRKLHVGLNSSSGLKTYMPSFPINFWLYIPQSEGDKAPID